MSSLTLESAVTRAGIDCQQRVAAELRHPCRKRLLSSFNAGSCCIISWLVNVFRFVEGRRRPHNPLGERKPVTLGQEPESRSVVLASPVVAPSAGAALA